MTQTSSREKLEEGMGGGGGLNGQQTVVFVLSTTIVLYCPVRIFRM